MTSNPLNAISTDQAPAAIGPYSQCIVAGNIVFISGQLPIDPDSGEIVTGDIKDKTRQCLKNIQAIATAAGAGLNRAVKLTIFLTDMNDFSAVNQVYSTFFNEPFPARSAVQVAGLPKNAPIEIEALFYL